MIKIAVTAAILSFALSVNALALNDDATKGKELFKKNCMQCHGITGEANTKIAKMLATPPANFDDPNYKDSRGKKLSEYTDDQLESKIKYGSKGTAMPSFKAKLNDKEIEYLVAYVRSFAKK